MTTTLATGLYLLPTSAGALHVVSTGADGPAERLLRRLLRADGPVLTDDADLGAWTGLDRVAALDVVRDAEALGWLEGHIQAPPRPEGPLAVALPELLAPLSDIGRVLLVDDQGFALASAGFTEEAETPLATLAAEIARMAQRRGVATFSAEPMGWALVDQEGASRVAFYPLVVGDLAFVLVVGGAPRLGDPTFVKLVAALSARYDATADLPTPSRSAGGTDHA